MNSKVPPVAYPYNPVFATQALAVLLLLSQVTFKFPSRTSSSPRIILLNIIRRRIKTISSLILHPLSSQIVPELYNPPRSLENA